MNTYVATAVMDPTGIRIDWLDQTVTLPDEVTVLEFVDELRGIAAHRPESKVKALVRNMGRDVADRAGSVTSLTIDHVGAIVCHPADQTAWQEATAVGGTVMQSSQGTWMEPNPPVPPAHTCTELDRRDEGQGLSPSSPPPVCPSETGPEPGAHQRFQRRPMIEILLPKIIPGKERSSHLQPRRPSTGFDHSSPESSMTTQTSYTVKLTDPTGPVKTEGG